MSIYKCIDGCDYQLDLDGKVTCVQCGAMDDDKEVIREKT